jgi:hypothetical protein
MNKFFKEYPLLGYYLIILGCLAKLTFVVLAVVVAL